MPFSAFDLEPKKKLISSADINSNNTSNTSIMTSQKKLISFDDTSVNQNSTMTDIETTTMTDIQNTPRKVIIKKKTKTPTIPFDASNDLNEKVEWEINETITNEYFKDKVFYERIDADRISALLKTTDFLKENEWWEDNSFTGIYGKKVCNEEQHLKQLLDNAIYNTDENSYYVEVKYFSKSTFGRIFPIQARSIFMSRREVRHYCLENIGAIDIDIKNAHPSIWLNIYNSIGCNVSKLGFYVKNRDYVIKSTMRKTGWDKRTTKDYFIALFNSGSRKGFYAKNTPKGETTFMKDFADEIANCIKTFIKINEKTELYKKITAGCLKNKTGRFLSYYGQIFEEQFLRCIFEKAVELNVIDPVCPSCIPSHDGIVFYKRDFENAGVRFEDFIKEVNDYIEEESGFKFIQYVPKDFDESGLVIDYMEKSNINDTEPYVDKYFEKYGVRKNQLIETRDIDIANAFLHNQKGKFIFSEGKYYSLNEYGIYKIISKKSFEEIFVKYMREMIENIKENALMSGGDKNVEETHKKIIENMFNLYESIKDKLGDDEKEKENPFTDFEKRFENVIKRVSKYEASSKNKLFDKCGDETKISSVVNRIESTITDDKFIEKCDTDHNLIGFENGVYDTIKHEFRQLKEGEFVSMSVGYNFIEKEDNEDMDEKCSWCWDFLHSYFPFESIEDKDIQKQQRDKFYFIMKAYARCLRGANARMDELAFFMKGRGSNGKSKLAEILQEIFGDYATTIIGGYFQSDKKECRSVDLFECYNKRIIFCSEPSKKLPFNSDTFKEWTGDFVKARTNFAKKNVKFRAGGLFFMSNHPIAFTSNDGDSMARRIRACEIKSQFFATDDARYKEDDPFIIERDDTINEKLQNDEWKMAFMWVMIDFLKCYDNGLEYTDENDNEIKIPKGLNKVPKSIQADIDDYFENLTEDAGWLGEIIERTDTTGYEVNLLTSSLYQYYLDNNKNPQKKGENAFSRMLTSNGYELGKATNCVDTDGKKKKGRCVKGVIFKGIQEEEE